MVEVFKLGIWIETAERIPIILRRVRDYIKLEVTDKDIEGILHYILMGWEWPRIAEKYPLLSPAEHFLLYKEVEVPFSEWAMTTRIAGQPVKRYRYIEARWVEVTTIKDETRTGTPFELLPFALRQESAHSNPCPAEEKASRIVDFLFRR